MSSDFNAFSLSRRLVVKVGSALLAPRGEGGAAVCRRLVADIVALRRGGAQVVVVSSGAVALGRPRLALPERGRLPLARRQAAAAAGQVALMAMWADALARHDVVAAQVLLTWDDTEVRRRWLNARATVEGLLRLGAVPVVNENDTVATEELRYGDNDRLAARVAQMVRAQTLVLLSDVDGLYARDPRGDPAAPHVAEVAAFTPEVLAMAGGFNQAAGLGTGGMASKLAAAAIAQAAGCETVIASGWAGDDAQGPLLALASGRVRATRVRAAAPARAAYKSWIAGALAPRGVLRVDAGAAAALRRGASLLPSGVTGVEGAFGKGDVVRVLGPAGAELARGRVRAPSAAARAAMGRGGADAEAFGRRAELIHRDDLVVLGGVAETAG